MERPNAFDWWGELRTLIGPELKPGDKAPTFKLTGPKDALISSDEFAGKPLVISVIPSIDTGVCSKQTRTFNESVATLGGKVGLLTVSADLPFTQARWCGAEGLDKVVMGSDYKELSFGDAYGTHIKDLRWESRAAFVVDAGGTIRYAEYVPVGGQEPNYDAVLEVAKGLI